jgi:hypothetical protein
MKKFKTRFRGSTDLKMNFWLQKYVYFVTDIIFFLEKHNNNFNFFTYNMQKK